jgi:hypothetical protein
VVKRSRALSEVARVYPWIVILLKRVRSGDFAVNKSITIKLECISDKEARIIGNNLMPALRARKTARAGVYQWRNQNNAMNELLMKFPWLTETFEELGEGVVKTGETERGPGRGVDRKDTPLTN